MKREGVYGHAGSVWVSNRAELKKTNSQLIKSLESCQICGLEGIYIRHVLTIAQFSHHRHIRPIQVKLSALILCELKGQNKIKTDCM